MLTTLALPQRSFEDQIIKKFKTYSQLHRIYRGPDNTLILADNYRFNIMAKVVCDDNLVSNLIENYNRTQEKRNAYTEEIKNKYSEREAASNEFLRYGNITYTLEMFKNENGDTVHDVIIRELEMPEESSLLEKMILIEKYTNSERDDEINDQIFDLVNKKSRLDVYITVFEFLFNSIAYIMNRRNPTRDTHYHTYHFGNYTVTLAPVKSILTPKTTVNTLHIRVLDNPPIFNINNISNLPSYPLNVETT